MAGKADSAKLCLAFKYCVDQVRKHDLEHYIGALYMPAEHRPTQFALRAFNVETSLIPDRAREQRLAVIRLAWWRDALTRLFQGQPPEDHPVLVALAAVKEARGIRKHWLHRVIAARMEDVERSAFPPNTIADVEQYAESTSSALLYLSMQAAGIHSVQADHAASHIGKAEGMALLLRGASYHAAQMLLQSMVWYTRSCLEGGSHPASGSACMTWRVWHRHIYKRPKPYSHPCLLLPNNCSSHPLLALTSSFKTCSATILMQWTHHFFEECGE
ncbi:hypothetical protein CLOP_g16960 [Closterium sp. NIES-67]|nr:hypothetical protein CLOP_g16960 [Closterium sp. NIES-67]